jgi:Leucine-rich repeat (LRR) protein
VVKLGGNELSSLPDGLFAKQIFLEELHLDRNKFVGVPNEAMKYLYHLSVLNMSGNLINRLSENSFDYVGSLLVS